MNNTKKLNDLLDQWIEFYQEVYHEALELNKCENLDKAKGQWHMVSQPNENTYIFENKYLKKSVKIVDDYVVGFFPQKDFAFFIHLDEYGKTQVEIGDLEYFQKYGAHSDWHISEITVTPEFLDEVCEGSFNSEESVENTQKALIELGFIEDSEFTKFMSRLHVPLNSEKQFN